MSVRSVAYVRPLSLSLQKLREFAANASSVNRTNLLSVPPLQPDTAWAPATTYYSRNVVSYNGNLFVAEANSGPGDGQSGVSGGSAPAGFSAPAMNFIQDNTVKWYWLGPQATTVARTGAPTLTTTNNNTGVAPSGAFVVNFFNLANTAEASRPVTVLGGVLSRYNAAQSVGGVCSTGYPLNQGSASVPAGNPGLPAGATYTAYGASKCRVSYYTDSPLHGLATYSTGGGGAPIRVWIDDQLLLISTINPVGGFANGQINYFSLNFNGERKRRKITWDIANYSLFGIYAAAQDSFWPLRRQDYVRAFFFMDSYGGQWDSQGDDLGTRISDILGWEDAWCASIPGTGFNAQSVGNNYNYLNRVADCYALCQSPDIIVLVGSANDANGTFSTGQITTNVTACLTAIRANTPSTIPIVVFGNPVAVYGSGFNPTPTQLDAAYLAGVTAAATANTYYFSQLNDAVGRWMSGTGYQGATTGTGNSDFCIRTDATHPTTYGRSLLAARMADKLLQVINAQ